MSLVLLVSRVLGNAIGKSHVRHCLLYEFRPDVCKVVQQKLKQFRWTIVPHPPYSPDLAPLDYHLLRSLQNFLNGQEFRNEAEVKSAIKTFFDSLVFLGYCLL